MSTCACKLPLPVGERGAVRGLMTLVRPNPLTPALSPPGRGRRATTACLLLAAVASFTLASAVAQDFDRGRRLFLEKADCAYCHGWAGDGAGQGQSPGGAANLRRSQLQRDQLVPAEGDSSIKVCGWAHLHPPETE